MKSRKILSLLLPVWLGLFSTADAQIKSSKPSIDDLIDWANPVELSQQKLTGLLDTHVKDHSKHAYNVRAEEMETIVSFHAADMARNSSLEDTFFNGLFKVQTVEFSYHPQTGKLSNIRIELPSENVTRKKLGTLEMLLSEKTGDAAPKEGLSKLSNTRFVQWANPKFMVRLFNGSRNLTMIIAPPFPGESPPGRPLAGQPARQPELSVNLDSLLNFGALWLWTPGDLEKNYVLKLEDPRKQQSLPQFEWMSTSKDRARFSRHMFSDSETNVTMFGRSIKVEEAILEFVNGKAARATISFYNRGDSGDIEVKEFDRIFKVIGQNLSQVMKVAPKRQMGSSNAALPVTGWNWTSPSGIALLEYNEYNTPGKESKPEFLRLKLAAPNQADWSMGKMATGVQRMELLQRVKKTPEGDVYISGVPMVDQGQKGYCVAASCQRLFEYMRIPCDQHEMAKLVSVDAEGGADISTMQKSLAKIDGAFKVTFKPLVNPELYYGANRRRRVSEKEFISIVKEYTDKGVPLLWGLMLGRKPEDPPLPNAGQISGGHMRMVIGYNLAKNQVIFTDSWGAGHELKRMAMLDAYDVTMGLYSMAPRGL